MPYVRHIRRLQVKAESLCFLFSFSFQQDGYVFLWPYNANLLVIRHFRIDPAATYVFFLDHVSK